MRVIETQEHLGENLPKMTLRGYYDSLPNSSHPKTEFVNEVASKTGVSTATVRNWISYGMKPNNPKHCEILSEITGIPVDNLWDEA